MNSGKAAAAVCRDKTITLSRLDRRLYKYVMSFAGVACVVFVILLSVYSAVISYFYWKGSNDSNPTLPTLPTLKNAPELVSVANSFISVGWNLNYTGDGPVCGSNVYVQHPLSTSWLSVGFVPVEEDVSYYQFVIDRLDAGTTYGISVRLLHCSGKEGAASPELSASTQNYGLPTLKNAPEVVNVTNSYIQVQWHLNYNGDGPVCGSNVYLQYPTSTSWSSVGFVHVEEDVPYYQFVIDRLDAGTTYSISVHLLHCLEKEGAASPTLSASTQNYVLPSLYQLPSTKASGTTYATILWQDEYVGDGPTCGYAIDRRCIGDDVTPWKTAGFVPLEPGRQSGEQRVFNLTCLEPSMDYQVSVRPIFCDGARTIQVGEGPLLFLTTSTIVLPTLKNASEVFNVTNSYISVGWNLNYNGDGPVCGSNVYLQYPTSTSWSSVGFVPVEEDKSYYQFVIDRLDAGTSYGISVRLFHCSGKEGAANPELSVPTQNYVLPSLNQHPNTTASGTTYATVLWQDEYIGDGPTCGYAIDKSGLGGNATPWMTAGLVPLEPGRQSGEQRVFNLTGLEPSMDYQVSVRPILCDGARIIQVGEGPLLFLTTSTIVLPTLKNAPEEVNVTNSYIHVEWNLDYNGDGPVCGSNVYLKSPSSTSWSSVGFVPVEEDVSYYQFVIDRLDAGTSYGISVRLFHCSGKEGGTNPELSVPTQNYVLPSLNQHPNTTASGTTYATILWQDEYIGDGPTCGYAIDKRGLGDDVTPWMTAGLVPLEPGPESAEQRVFNLTGLKPSMDYQVSVRPILCDGARIIQVGEGSLLYLTTSTIELPTLTTAPILTNLSTSHVVFEWSSEHHGDGPVCGNDINLKKVVDDDNELWFSVGFVPVGSELEFYIGHLEADTDYLVAVSVINCLSGEDGPRRPVLSFRTIGPVTKVISPAVPDMPDGTDITEIPPATATSACPSVNCTECGDWKLAFTVVTALLFLLI
ncbi:uncharacterized protein LOC129263236 isoform X2 [Lytechinus pictus]|uniref:uncharacterized protein LOC129263236 isoform X2 n=1 Tax=Lytechinus pictus TaxID=7653 RepID=UPI0030BA27B8